MSLRSQTQPYVLIGNLSDLPNPSSVAQCTLYHSADTGDCFVLSIDPATGVRSWQEFCGATNMTGIEGPALLAFAGGNTVSNAVYDIANDTGLSDSISAAGIVPDYPLFRSRIALNFNVNLRNRATVSDVVVVDLLANGIVILTCTFPASASHNGVANAPGPANIPAGAKLNVRVTSPSAISSTQVSATVELF